MSPRAANCLTPRAAGARLLLRQTRSTGRGQDVVKGGIVIRAAHDWSTVVPGAARNACIILRDAVNNLIEIVKYEESCLVYDRP